jgi:hypothetical protein
VEVALNPAELSASDCLRRRFTQTERGFRVRTG